MTNNPVKLINIQANIYKGKIIPSLNKQSLLSLWLLICCIVLIGCSTTQPPVPVIDGVKTDTSTSKSTEASSSVDNQSYIVQKGDTLYSIALNHGIDFKKLAEWNNITDPRSIKPGQKISLSIPSAADSQPTLFALPQQPLETTIGAPTEQSTINISQENNIRKNLKTSPKAFKLPFSEQNVARLKLPVASVNISPPAKASQSFPTAEKNTRIEIAPQPEPQKSNRTIKQSDAEWIWPTTGRLSSSFSKNSKGVKISGQVGQSILASAGGEVVYSGHGLRGYGNLIIIKHNNTFLSAYAHNSKILVKEGETVTKGQKIAEMGNTDSDTVQLHFEIRKNGKPVDPMEYLPDQS
jgi:lipoprotein NlpD